MDQHASENLPIGPLPLHWQRIALMNLGMAADAPLVQQLPSSLPELLGAWDDSDLHGAVWAQLLPGRTVTIWPPWTSSGDDELACRLAVAAVEFALAKGVRLAQALLPLNDVAAIRRLEAAGLTHAADVECLVWQVDGDQESYTSTELFHAPWRVQRYDAATDRPRMERLLEGTSALSLDCPALSGIRPPAEVFDGYFAAGRSGADHWYFLSDGQEDAGCLLLADHPQQDEMELVYLGVLPLRRGRGLGRKLVQFAQQEARRAGRKNLLTAVDAANSPARVAYAAAGFVSWDKRQVLLRVWNG